MIAARWPDKRHRYESPIVPRELMLCGPGCSIEPEPSLDDSGA
jgi:hypothetical protein